MAGKEAEAATNATTRGQRPLSLYDNIQQQHELAVADLSAASLLGPQPTQALSLATTVPVNLARSPIVGRHQPSRASVRHSRMLVLSQQNGTVPFRYLPPVVRWHNLAAFLSSLLALMGVAGIIFAFLLILQAPFLLLQDLPFWSGTLNLVAGMAGVVLVCWCRRLTPGVPAPDWVCEASQSCIVMCIIFMIISLATTVSTLIFHILRLIWIFQLTCLLSPLLGFSTASNATLDDSSSLIDMMSDNSTDTLLENLDLDSAVLGSCQCTDAVTLAELSGLGCPVQREQLVGLFLGSALVHILATVVILGYLIIHWRSRHYNQSVYSAVQRPAHSSATPVLDTSNNGF